MQACENTTSWPLGRNGADNRRTVRCLRCRPAGPCGSAGHRGGSDLHLDGLLCGCQRRLGLARQQPADRHSRRCVPGTLFFPDNGDGGFTGGGQIGYNYQIGSFVIGLETDIQWADTDQDETVAFIPLGAPGTFVPGTFDNNLSDWFGTVRARAGVAFDRVLIYATGGLAYTDNNTGWVAGGGVEWALPVNWFGSSAVTFGLEGLWLSFDSGRRQPLQRPVGTFTPVGGGPRSTLFAPATQNNENEFFVARAKLNFKFGTY